MGGLAKRNLEYQEIIDNAGAIPQTGIKFEKGKPLPLHEEYVGLCKKWSFLEASYKGGAAYKDAKDAKGFDVLIKHEQESAKAWERRKRMSTCHNFCRPLVDKMIGFVFSQPITRDAGDQFQEWSEDVDGNDVCLAEFIKLATLRSCILGRWFIVVDTTKTDSEMTLAQAQAANTRIILSDLHPSRVINWTKDSLLVTEESVGPYGGARLWRKDTYQDIVLGKDYKVASIMSEVAHGWKAGMPIVWVKPHMSAESLVEDVAELQMSIFNLDSLLREELSKSTFSQWWLACPSATGDMLQAFDVGSRKVIVIPVDANTVKFERLSSDASQAQSLQETIEGEVREIYRTMGLRDPLTESGPESGRALKIRFTESAFRAAEISDMACDAEERITDLVEGALGVEIESPEYPENFDDENLNEELGATIQVISADLPSSCKRAQVSKWADLAFGNRLEVEEMQEMRQEIEDKYSAEAEAAKQAEREKGPEGQSVGQNDGSKPVDGKPSSDRDVRYYQNPAYAKGSKAPQGPMYGI